MVSFFLLSATALPRFIFIITPVATPIPVAPNAVAILPLLVSTPKAEVAAVAMSPLCAASILSITLLMSPATLSSAFCDLSTPSSTSTSSLGSPGFLPIDASFSPILLITFLIASMMVRIIPFFSVLASSLASSSIYRKSSYVPPSENTLNSAAFLLYSSCILTISYIISNLSKKTPILLSSIASSLSSPTRYELKIISFIYSYLLT